MRRAKSAEITRTGTRVEKTRHRRRRLVVALALAGLGGVSLGACSLALEFLECRDNDDCQSVDEGSPIRACNSENKCVEAADIECTSNTQCGDLFGSSFICGVAARCVNTTTAECEPVVWPEGVDRDKVVFLGSIMPLGAAFLDIVQPLENAIDLAIQDFNNTTELPGGRSIAWIACNSEGLPDKAVAAAEHLSNAVGTPAVIGPAFSENVIKVADEVTVPAGVFTITPSATSKTITTLNDDNLVWRPIPSDVYQANALTDFVLNVQDPAPDTVVFLAKDDAYGEGLLLDASSRIEEGVAAFSAIVYPNPATLSSDELTQSLGAVIGQAFALSPDTVVIAGTSEAEPIILGYLLAWADLPADSRPELPVFVVTHGAVPVLESTIESVPDPTLQALMYTKLEGVAPIIHDVENFEVYNTRYKITFGNKDAITSSSLSYDSAMVAILAMATIPAGETITGARIAEGMARLVDANAAEISFGDDAVNLSFIKDARNTLEQGGSVNLKGVSGELDFQLDTGEVRVDLINWHLVERNPGDYTDALLDPQRVYLLNPAPAEDGQWIHCDMLGC